MDIVEKRAIRSIYFGALLALGVDTAPEAAGWLVDLTESPEECSQAIEVMRTAKPGDRVYPAMAYLRRLREAERGKPVGES